MTRTRLIVFFVVAVAYCVLATGEWVTHWVALLPLMGRPVIGLFFRFWWYGVELVPITVAVTLLRFNPVHAVLTVFVMGLVMRIAEFAFTSFDTGEAFGIVLNAPVCYLMQIPVWGVTLLAMKLASARRQGATN